MKFFHKKIKPIEAVSCNSTKMGIRFFKDMPQEMRNEIAGYLSKKDLANLRAASREFHGPINWHCEYAKKDFAKKWAKKTFSKMMKPVSALDNRLLEEISEDPDASFRDFGESFLRPFFSKIL